MAKEPTFKEKVIAVLDEQIEAEKESMEIMGRESDAIKATMAASNRTLNALSRSRDQIITIKQRETNGTTKEEE